MSDSTKKTSENLIGLFSTRNDTPRSDSSGDLLRNNATSTPKGGTTTTTSSMETSQANAKGHLSPQASMVLREARRELGADYATHGDDPSRVVSETQIVQAVDKVIKRRAIEIDDIERANVIIHLQKDLVGWGVLQPLIDNREVTDIHCYDFQTVVLQRGKQSETTGIHWPSREAYIAFIDRLLMRLGKSLSTQQHTVDASFPNGIRLCAVHESVCGMRGPLLTIRVPRIIEASLETLLAYQVAPPLIVNYLASLIRCGKATMIIAGETGTGKTTLLRCLGTQFGPDESIIAVEDTPELNFQHPYFRSLVSRTANTEGIGQVTLQEHITTTLRLTPTRVVLGEMRSPLAGEAFLESAQTGHIGMSTIHARNAKETLVRLESLLGRAQKSVSIEIIRQQIALAVDSIVWMIREKGTGKVRIGEIIEVGRYVEGMIQVKPMFSLIHMGERPIWQVHSWNSSFDEDLAKDGIYLNQAPPELTFGNMS
ncbi:MAG: ATPase, T2SS/T4P/T4SS family [bacterium]|nr:ATPase, T2SS/T4P/T4SS family [bacterium]